MFKKSSTSKNLIILDIGTQFLKALALEIDRDDRAGILHDWVREKTTNDLEKLYPVCKKAIDKLKKKTGIKGKQLFLGINCGIAQSVSTTFCFKRENPQQKIDSTELKNLVQKAQWKAFDRIRKVFALETGLLETDTKLINANIISIKVDDKKTANPLGFQGKTICLSIFNTYTSSHCLEKLTKLISRLGLELIGINSPSYALFNCLDLNDSSNKDVLIIDIGGKITEIGLIKNKGEVIEAKSFNLGGQAFTKTIADFLGLERNEAEAIKIKYSKGGVGSDAKRKLQKLLASDISSWLAGVIIVLDDFLKKHKTLPSKILLCGGGSNLPGIKKALKQRGDFQIKLISPKEIIKIENKTKLDNIPCLALAELASKSIKETEFSPILKRVIKLIQE